MKSIRNIIEGLLDNDFDVTKADVNKTVISNCLGRAMIEYRIEGDTLIIPEDEDASAIELYDVNNLKEIGLNHIRVLQKTILTAKNRIGTLSGMDIIVEGDIIIDDYHDTVIDGCNIQCDNLWFYSHDGYPTIEIKRSKLNIKHELMLDTDKFKIHSSNKIDCPTFRYKCSPTMGDHKRLIEMGLGSLSMANITKAWVKRMNELSSTDPAEYRKMFIDIDPIKFLKLDKVKWPNLSKIVIPTHGLYASSTGYVIWNQRKGATPISPEAQLTKSIEYGNNWHANLFLEIFSKE